MKHVTMSRPEAQAKTTREKESLLRAIAGGLRPVEPNPACRFCGEDCGGFH